MIMASKGAVGGGGGGESLMDKVIDFVQLLFRVFRLTKAADKPCIILTLSKNPWIARWYTL